MPDNATPIEAISLEFYENSSKAIKGIEAVTRVLERLSQVSPMNPEVTARLRDVASAINGIDIKTETVDKLSKLGDALSKVASAKVSASALKKISSISVTGEISPMENVVGATAVSGDITKDISDLPQEIGPAVMPLKELTATSNTAGLNLRDLYKDNNTLADSYQNLADRITEAAEAQKKSAFTTSLMQGLSDNTTMPRIEAISSVNKDAMFGLSEEIDNLALSIPKVTPLIEAESSALKNLASSAKEAYVPLEMLTKRTHATLTRPEVKPVTVIDNESMQEATRKFAEAGNVSGTVAMQIKTNMLSVGGAIDYVRDKTKELYAQFSNSRVGKEVGKFTSSATAGLKSLGSELKKLGSTTIKTNGGLTKLLGSIKRIALYRAIRFALKQITQSFKEGVSNLYEWSNAFDSTREFADSMDRIATAVLYVRNSLGAMVAPIINAVAPAIDFLADKFVMLLNIINEFIAAITGAETYTVARKIGTQFKEIEDGAKGAAKAVKTFTIGIDELNIIQDTGSSGGGASGLNNVAEDWFRKETVSNEMKSFADKIKEMAENVRGYFEYMFSGQGWYDIGELLAKGWDNAKTNAQGYFDYLNSGDATIDVANIIGEWGADRIEDALDFAYKYFVFVLKVAKELPGAIDKVVDASDKLENSFIWKFVVETMPVTFRTWYDTVQPVFEIFKDLWKIFKEIKSVVSDIVTLIGIFSENISVKNVFGFTNLASQVLGQWTTGGNGNKSIGGQIIETVKDQIVSAAENSLPGTFIRVFATPVKELINNFKNSSGPQIGSAFDNGVKNGIVNNTGVLTSAMSQLGIKTYNAFKNANTVSMYEKTGQNIIEGIKSGISSKYADIIKKAQNTANDILKAVNKQLGIKSPSREFMKTGAFIVEGLNKGITDNENSTLGIVSNWASSISNAGVFDFSNVSMPSVADIVDEVQGYIATTGAMTVKADSDELATVLEDMILPLLSNIATDTKRQADKNETTEVVLDGRKVTESVSKQIRVNGYSFTT